MMLGCCFRFLSLLQPIIASLWLVETHVCPLTVLQVGSGSMLLAGNQGVKRVMLSVGFRGEWYIPSSSFQKLATFLGSYPLASSSAFKASREKKSFSPESHTSPRLSFSISLFHACDYTGPTWIISLLMLLNFTSICDLNFYLPHTATYSQALGKKTGTSSISHYSSYYRYQKPKSCISGKC